MALLLVCFLSACSPPSRMTSKHYISPGNAPVQETTHKLSSSSKLPDSTEQKVTREHTVSYLSRTGNKTSSEAEQTESDSPDELHYNGYYYKNLTVGQKNIYKKIDKAVYEMKNGYIDLGEAQYSSIVLAYAAVINDRPEYFWLDQSKYGIKYENGRYYMCFSGAVINDRRLSYLYFDEQKQLLQQQLEQRLSRVTAEAQKKESDYEKALFVHDWLVKNVEYDYATAEAVINKNQAGIDKDSFTILGALLPGQTADKGTVKAVCEGYAKAYHCILRRLGLESLVVTGKYNGYGHMWNCVKIDGEWYFTDCTNDDIYPDTVGHTFFNVSRRALSRIYDIDRTVTPYTVEAITEDESFNFCLPLCDSTRHNYFVVNNRCLAPEDFNLEAATVKATDGAIKRIADLIISENASRVKVLELCFNDETDFVFNEDTTETLICLTEIAEQVQRLGTNIKNIKAKGINSAKGFMLYWE